MYEKMTKEELITQLKKTTSAKEIALSSSKELQEEIAEMQKEKKILQEANGNNNKVIQDVENYYKQQLENLREHMQKLYLMLETQKVYSENLFEYFIKPYRPKQKEGD